MKLIFSTLILLTSLNVSAKKINGDVIKASDFNSSTFNVGSIQHSLLSTEQFQNLSGNCWVKMTGQNITGSDYHAITGQTNLPDTQGRFLRDTGGDAPSFRTQQNDAIVNITGLFGAEGLSRDTGAMSASGALYHASRIHNAYGGTGYVGSVQIGFDASRVVQTANEVRPKNISVNYFIKINKNCN